MKNLDWKALAVVLIVLFAGTAAVKLSWGYSDELAKNGIVAKAPMFMSRAALSTAMGGELEGWSKVIEKSALLVTSTGVAMIGAAILAGSIFLGSSMFRVTMAVSRGIELGARAQYQERETDAKIRLVASTPPIQVGPGTRVGQHLLDRGRPVIVDQPGRAVVPVLSKPESIPVSAKSGGHTRGTSAGGIGNRKPAASYPVTRIRSKRVSRSKG